MSINLLALGLSCVAAACAAGASILAARARREAREAYRQGYAYACARAVGAVAAELGPGDPLVDRMIDRLGANAPQ